MLFKNLWDFRIHIPYFYLLFARLYTVLYRIQKIKRFILTANKNNFNIGHHFNINAALCNISSFKNTIIIDYCYYLKMYGTRIVQIMHLLQKLVSHKQEALRFPSLSYASRCILNLCL